MHRLSEIGAVVTHVAHGISQDGFDAEWRDVHVLAVEGELFSRSELFNEADLDAAIARFDQLSRPATRLENAASRANERSHAYFAARDWDAIAEIVADDISTDDRRRVVNAGLLQGRGASIESFRWAADLGVTHATSDPIATRGERLVLARARYSHSDDQPQPFDVDLLNIVEINADGRIGAVVIFDLEDIDSAIAELDARYLAGEAAAHSRTWSVIMQGYASLNRRELPPTTPDWVNIDHRRGTSIAPGGIPELLTAAWNVTSDLNNFVEAVHRLDNLGGVVTHVANETSQDGFHAEWRVVSVFTVKGDMVNRCEVFDEADLDTAIERFDQLTRPAPRLENTASRANARFVACANAHDWDAIASILAEDHYSDDRRRVTGAGTRRGPDADIEHLQVLTELGATITVEVIATRGDRLILTRTRVSFDQQQQQQGFVAEVLSLVETDLDGRIAATILLDLEDFDAAIAELDVRYIAGEAAAHAHTWSVIAQMNAAFNRRELPPTTPDWVNIDHRQGTSIAPGEMPALLSAAWNVTSDLSNFIEAVHRLDNLGAVITHVANETTQEGFHAEWRVISLLALDGDLVNRCEVFDEADLDAAIARFNQLNQPVPRLENAASQVAERFMVPFTEGDSDAVAEMLADNFSSDDRRRVVGAGVRLGRDAQIADVRAIADLWIMRPTVMATRGDRLVLMRVHFSGRDQGPAAFLTEVLGIVEINADERIVATVAFGIDDIDAAFEELDARYIAGEAANHSRTWSVIAGGHAALNRHELPPTTPDCVSIDHRRGTAFAPGDVKAYTRAAWSQTPDISFRIETVHQLSDLGARHHSRGPWDLARGLRGGVARDPPYDRRRRPVHPQRTLRRGRPRRRARPL